MMKRIWISFMVASVVCLTGAIGVAQQTYYSQEISNCPQCNSSPQYQVYESAPQQVYQNSYSAYQPASTNQSSFIYGDQQVSATQYSAPVVYDAVGSGQIVYADQIYSGTQYANPVVVESGYSSVLPTSYPSAESSVSSYSTVSAPVYSAAPENYQSQSYPAQGFQTSQQYSQATYGQPVGQSYEVTQTASSSGNYYASTNPQPGLAQQKADQAAQMRFRDHIGGGLGGAKYEGVGWSNQSAQSAIQNCCYWGQRPTAQIGISKSSDGCWYACVLYH